MIFNPEMLDDFVRRRVAIFLGAGVSAGVKTRGGTNVKTWGTFLNEAAVSTGKQEIIHDVNSLVEKDDYLFACEILKSHFGDDWERALKEEYERIGDLTDLQRNLLELKQRIIVTTNFDLFIESHWDEVRKDATHHLQVKNGISAECFSAFRDDRDYLIKLHGSINVPETMIFSLGDYAAKAHANWQYSLFMEMLLTTHTVLFVGFSMNDATITNLLEIYAKKYPKSRPHYAFLADYTSEVKRNIMKTHRKLFVMPYSSANNHEELITLTAELTREVKQRIKLSKAEIISA